MGGAQHTSHNVASMCTVALVVPYTLAASSFVLAIDYILAQVPVCCGDPESKTTYYVRHPRLIPRRRVECAILAAGAAAAAAAARVTPKGTLLVHRREPVPSCTQLSPRPAVACAASAAGAYTRPLFSST